MSNRKVGSIIVTKKHNPKEMTGIFTERDYLRKIVLKDLFSKNTPITQVMTKVVKTAPMDWSLIDVIQAMAAGPLRHLPVTLDGKRHLHYNLTLLKRIFLCLLELFLHVML
jgi:signal-transduction protein with cAMP-binding, CBS, and nucleotidyltransferase domain